MTSFITPNPGIHTFPKLDSTQFTIQDFDQLVAWGEQLLYGIANWIVLALDNISVLGIHPFVQLQAFGQQVAAAVAQLEALINGIGGTANADVVAAINLAQRIIDDIVKLLTGGTGSNYALTDLNAALQSIPGGFINGITATEQNIINNINTALGQAGTTIASIQTALKSIPTANMLPQLGGANIGDDIQQWANSFVGNISGEATGSLAAIQNQWTQFTKGFIGYTPPASSGAQPGTPPGNSLAAFSQTTDGFNKGQASTKQIANNVDPTLDPTFHLSTVSTTMPTIAVTQSTSTIGMISIPDISAQKQELVWLGYPSGGSMSTFTGFYFNVYAMNLSTGALSWVYTTPNLQGSVASGSSVAWNYYQIPNTTTSGTTTACAVQTVNLGTPTGGTYNLTFGSATTSALAWNASAATVQTALAALSGIGSGNVNVVAVNPNSSAAYGGPFIVTFTGTLANTAQTMLTISSSLTGSNTTAAVSPYFGVFQGDVYAVELVVVGGGTYNLVGQTSLIPAISGSTYPKQLGASRTASGALTPPTRDAVGAGSRGGNGNPITITYSHTISTAASNGGAVLVWASIYSTASAPTVTAKVGTTSMSQIGGYQYTTGAYIGLFILLNPPTGTQTISVTSSGAGTQFVAANSVSYLNVSGYGTVQTTNGTSASASQTVTSSTGAATVQAFSSVSTNFGSYSNATTLSNQNFSNNVNIPLIVGGNSGAASSTFTSTLAASAAWGGMGVPLYGALYLPGGTIASPTYSSTTPWLALSGAASVTQYPPVLTTFSTAGTFSYSVPSWANKLDVIVVGGGGGMFTTTTTAVYYTGGLAGQWSTATWSAAGLSTVAVTVGAGGAAQGAAYPSSAVATGRTTVSGAGGTAGGSSYGYAYISGFVGSWYQSAGMSPGNQLFNGNTYYGGGAGAANAPGGGGQGTSVFGGGAGAAGAVFILAYQ